MSDGYLICIITRRGETIRDARRRIFKTEAEAQRFAEERQAARPHLKYGVVAAGEQK
jgi:hypothetical protein